MAEALTTRQRAFLDALETGLPPGRAAAIAGYASPDTQGARLVKNPNIRRELATNDAKDPQIMTRVERLRWLSAWIRDEGLPIQARVTSLALMAKLCNDEGAPETYATQALATPPAEMPLPTPAPTVTPPPSSPRSGSTLRVLVPRDDPAS